MLDEAGTNSLSLVVVKGVLPGGGPANHFRSLVWRTREETKWVDRCAINHRDFQGGKGRRRWVSDIHSLDSSKGSAVIKVAEESSRVISGSNITVKVVYSWREWNLLTNGEIRVLQVCQNPLEEFSTK